MSLVLLVGEDGKKIGNVPIEQAEAMAKEAGKNLQLVDGNNKVYRIVDAGKLNYERKKKLKKQKSQHRTHKVKEIKLRVSTDQHDLEIKTKRIREFLEKGLKTKITMQFKGRQMSMQSVGFEKMNALIASAIEGGIAKVDRAPKMEGRNMTAFLIPVK